MRIIKTLDREAARFRVQEISRGLHGPFRPRLLECYAKRDGEIVSILIMELACWSIHIGIHGETKTPGILRDVRTRLHLFGDTMNMLSPWRMHVKLKGCI
jgi:hypothetical protein